MLFCIILVFEKLVGKVFAKLFHACEDDFYKDKVGNDALSTDSEWTNSAVRPDKPKAVVLNWGGGVKKFSGEREPLRALQHGKFLNGNVYLTNVTPVRIFTSLLV